MHALLRADWVTSLRARAGGMAGNIAAGELVIGDRASLIWRLFQPEVQFGEIFPF